MLNMEIELLQNLRDNPHVGLFENKGIPLEEIVVLESTYNNGNPFPSVLREMLFLAGEFCPVLDFGLTDTQHEMQEETRYWLAKYNREIVRPFYVIDVYNAGEQCLCIYLDKDEPDPIVYSAVFYSRPFDPTPWLHALTFTMSQLIDRRLDRLKNGENPF